MLVALGGVRGATLAGRSRQSTVSRRGTKRRCVISLSKPSATRARANWTESAWFTAFNVGGFYAVWYGVVLAVQQRWLLLALAIGLAYLLLHLFLVRRRRSELALIVAVGVLGAGLDTVFAATGSISYTATPGWLPPLWGVVLWAGFATGINHSLRRLRSKPLLTALLGAVCGPLAYLGLQQMGCLQFQLPVWYSLGILAAAFAFLLPAVFHVATLIAGADLAAPQVASH